MMKQRQADVAHIPNGVNEFDTLIAPAAEPTSTLVPSCEVDETPSDILIAPAAEPSTLVSNKTENALAQYVPFTPETVQMFFPKYQEVSADITIDRICNFFHRLAESNFMVQNKGTVGAKRTPTHTGPHMVLLPTQDAFRDASQFLSLLCNADIRKLCLGHFVRGINTLQQLASEEQVETLCISANGTEISDVIFNKLFVKVLNNGTVTVRGEGNLIPVNVLHEIAFTGADSRGLGEVKFYEISGVLLNSDIPLECQNTFVEARLNQLPANCQTDEVKLHFKTYFDSNMCQLFGLKVKVHVPKSIPVGAAPLHAATTMSTKRKSQKRLSCVHENTFKDSVRSESSVVLESSVIHDEIFIAEGSILESDESIIIDEYEMAPEMVTEVSEVAFESDQDAACDHSLPKRMERIEFAEEGQGVTAKDVEIEFTEDAALPMEPRTICDNPTDVSAPINWAKQIPEFSFDESEVALEVDAVPFTFTDVAILESQPEAIGKTPTPAPECTTSEAPFNWEKQRPELLFEESEIALELDAVPSTFTDVAVLAAQPEAIEQTPAPEGTMSEPPFNWTKQIPEFSFDESEIALELDAVPSTFTDVAVLAAQPEAIGKTASQAPDCSSLEDSIDWTKQRPEFSFDIESPLELDAMPTTSTDNAVFKTQNEASETSPEAHDSSESDAPFDWTKQRPDFSFDDTESPLEIDAMPTTPTDVAVVKTETEATKANPEAPGYSASEAAFNSTKQRPEFSFDDIESPIEIDAMPTTPTDVAILKTETEPVAETSDAPVCTDMSSENVKLFSETVPPSRSAEKPTLDGTAGVSITSIDKPVSDPSLVSVFQREVPIASSEVLIGVESPMESQDTKAEQAPSSSSKSRRRSSQKTQQLAKLKAQKRILLKTLLFIERLHEDLKEAEESHMKSLQLFHEHLDEKAQLNDEYEKRVKELWAVQVESYQRLMSYRACSREKEELARQLEDARKEAFFADVKKHQANEGADAQKVALRRRLTDSEKEVAEAKESLAVAQKEARVAQEDITNLRTRLAAAESKVADAEKEATETSPLRARLAFVEKQAADVKELQIRLNAAEREAAAAKKESAEASKLRNRLDIVEMEAAEAKKLLVGLSAAEERAEKEAVEAAETSQLRAQLVIAQREAAEAKQLRIQLSAADKEAAEADTLRHRLAAAEEESNRLRLQMALRDSQNAESGTTSTPCSAPNKKTVKKPSGARRSPNLRTDANPCLPALDSGARAHTRSTSQRVVVTPKDTIAATQANKRASFKSKTFARQPATDHSHKVSLAYNQKALSEKQEAIDRRRQEKEEIKQYLKLAKAQEERAKRIKCAEARSKNGSALKRVHSETANQGGKRAIQDQKKKTWANTG
ncbi:hypothetical protein HDU76_005625, partial [Blyttiomyces sp. JEL0837]